MPFHAAPSGSMHYEVLGEGPAVVLLHGISNYGLVWAPQLDVVVNRGWRAIVPDLAGHGLSAPVEGTTTAADLAGDVVHLLDALGVETAVLCGLSLGSMVAQHLLVDAPARVLGAVLVAAGPHLAFPRAKEMIGSWTELWLSENGPVKRLDATWPFLTTETYRSSYAGQAYYAGWRRVLASVDGRSLAAIASGLLSFDVRHGLRGVRRPVIAVAGEEDSLAPPPMVEEVASLVPGGRFEVLPRAGHIANRERPELFNALLGGFLDVFGSPVGANTGA